VFIYRFFTFTGLGRGLVHAFLVFRPLAKTGVGGSDSQLGLDQTPMMAPKG
jgi:hypothetical protein